MGGSVISFISPYSGSSLGPVQPICAERWPKTPFMSFQLNVYFYQESQPVWLFILIVFVARF